MQKSEEECVAYALSTERHATVVPILKCTAFPGGAVGVAEGRDITKVAGGVMYAQPSGASLSRCARQAGLRRRVLQPHRTRTP